MKKAIFALLIIVSSIIQVNAICIIRGVWKRADTKVLLYKISDGQIVEIASSSVNSNHEFTIAFVNNDPGLYVVGTSEVGMVDKYVFYFREHDQLNVTFEEDRYYLTGKNTRQNIELARWHDLILPIEYPSVYFMYNTMNYKEYFPLLENKLPQIKAFTPQYTSDKAFNNTFEKYRKFHITYILLNFLHTPRTEHPDQTNLPSIYNDIHLADLTLTDDILKFPFGLRLVGAVMYIENNREIRDGLTPDFVESNISRMTGPIVKAETILYNTQEVESYDKLVQYANKYKNLLVREDHKLRMENILAQKYKNSGITKAYDFRFQDANGNMISLSDFKGKAVYIDIWTTWCGPCRKLIPHLKELAMEYQGRDIVFLGVSADAQEDYEKWKQVIEDEELPGIQIFAGKDQKNILNPYGIKSFPHFILIDKYGNVVDGNVHRPSSDKIRPLLDSLLSK